MKLAKIAAAFSVIFFISSCGEQAAVVDLNNLSNVDSVSLAIGQSIGENLKKGKAQGLNVHVIAEGIRIVLDEDSAKKMDALVANDVIQKYFKDIQQSEIDENEAKGKEYAESYKTQEGVVALPNGLAYRIITEGDGPIPTAQDQVTTHYTGKLIDGTVFDSSIPKGSPATFGVTGVIKGWTEILQMMPVGSKWEVLIPADLAYGQSRGPSGSLPPMSTLIFEIELLEIAK